MKPINEMTTSELLSEYNTLTGKSVKRFSSRAAGEKQVLAVRARPATVATGTVVSPGAFTKKTKKKKAPLRSVVARKVRGAAAAEKSGRPAASFTVVLSAKAGTSKPNSKSLRRQLITWLGTLVNKSATIDRIEEKFGRSMRGVVNKLMAKDWVSKTVNAA